MQECSDFHSVCHTGCFHLVDIILLASVHNVLYSSFDFGFAKFLLPK